MRKNKLAVNIILLIIVVNIGSKIIGFIRDAVIGNVFGAGIESDVYFSSLTNTTTFFLCLGTAISTTIVPIATRLQKASKAEREESLNSIFNAIHLISLVLCLIFLIFAPQILGVLVSGYDVEKFDEAVKITRILTPTVFFIGITYVQIGLLQVYEKFLIPAVVSLSYNLIIIVYLYTGVDRFGIMGLAVVTLIGWFSQMAFQLPFFYRVARFPFKLAIDFNNPHVRTFLFGLLPIGIVSSTKQFTILCNNAFASHFENGIVTSLYMANQLFMAIVTTAVYAVSAVMFPKFSQSFENNEKTVFFQSITKVLQGMSIILLPVSVGLALVSENTISVVLLRGAFTASDVKDTAIFLAVLSSYMLAFGYWDILNKAFYTMGNKKYPIIICGVITLVNYLLDFVLVPIMGIAGITMATSLAFYVGAFIGLWFFKAEKDGLNYRSIMGTTGKALLGVSFMTLFIFAFRYVYQLIWQAEGKAMQMVEIMGEALVGAIVYFLVMYVMKEENFMLILLDLKSKYKFRKIFNKI